MKKMAGEIKKPDAPSAGPFASGNPTADTARAQSNRTLGWVILPLRLFLGITFVYGGIQKLTDMQYFDPSARGYIGRQIQAIATGSPLHVFLINIVQPHASLFGALVAYGELAIGISVLLGFLTRLAAFFGLLLNVLFFLSATWRVHPYFYGSDIVFIFCWITLLFAGSVSSVLFTVDVLIVSILLKPSSSGWRSKLGRTLRIILGVRESVFSQSIARQTNNNRFKRYPATMSKNHKLRRSVTRQPNKTRRSFIWGTVTGGIAMLALAWLAETLHLIPQNSNATVSPTPTSIPAQGTPGSPVSTATPGTSRIIGNVSYVPANSSTTFILPSNNDPGILIHLNNGQFVAYDAACTHAGCPVDYDPSTQHLICPCHGAEFDPAHAAAVLGGPTNIPLTGVPIHIDNASGAISL